MFRPVGMATLSNGTMKLLRQGPRPLKSGFEFCSKKSILKKKTFYS